MERETIKQIYVIFLGGLSGNYLGYNIGTYITKRFTGTPEMVNQITNEYYMGPGDESNKINCTHINLLDRKHIRDMFFDTNKVKKKLRMNETFGDIKVKKDSKIIIIHNNWNIAYTQAVSAVKHGYAPDNEWCPETDQEKKELQETYSVPYARMSANFKEEGYDVFDLEFKDLFIDKDKNKYIEICNYLGEDYSNEGYLHLSEYIELYTTLMKGRTIYYG
jgi:hypothetical protein